MLERWVVLLEAADDRAAGEIGPDELRRLFDALDPGPWGSGLLCTDRYALQVTATGASPAEALIDVLARWSDAVRELGLPVWKVVRTEVLTPEELERECEGAQLSDRPIRSPSPVSHDRDEIGNELLRRAFSDSLTGLLGREAFVHRLEAALRGAADGRRAGVVSLDLDGFGTVNRNFGGTAGDEVLVAMAERLATMLRVGDVVARFGADEYAVLLEDTTEDGAAAVAARMVDGARRPITVRDQEVTLSSSAGVAVSAPEDDAQDVLGKAAAALALAKAAGGDSQVLYGPTTTPAAQVGAEFHTGALQDRLALLLLTQAAAVAANEAQTLHQAAQVVMRQICAHVGCDIGHLWISPAAGDELGLTPVWHVADTGTYRPFVEASQKLLVRSGVGLLGQVLATGRPVWISELAADASCIRKEAAAQCGLQSAFAFPVLVGPEVVAVLEFASRTRMEPIGSFVDVVAGIGTQLGRVVERQRAAAAQDRSQEQLRQSERQLREGEALARLGSWHFDLRTGERGWSEGMRSLHGLAPGQHIELASALERVHPDDRERAQAALSHLVETGERTTEEVRVVRADGQVRWHHVEGSAITDPDGLVVAIRGTSQDITPRKVAEEELRSRERQLTEAQLVARLGWWERDLSSETVTWSEEMQVLWGWEPGRPMNFETFLATVHPEDRPRLLEDANRLWQTVGPLETFFRAVVGDGQLRWFRGHTQVLRDEQGTPVKVVGTVQDVTEQKQAEEELRTSKESYQRILQTAHEGIITVNNRYITTFANARMAQILGYSVEEMTGMPASAFLDAETYAALAAYRQRRRSGMSEHYETELRTKDGSAVNVRISASPLFDGDGEYAGTLALITDITALREAENIVRSGNAHLHAT